MTAQKIFELASSHFRGDFKKLYAWFEAPLTELGGDSPRAMIKKNQSEKLLRYLQKKWK